MSIMDTLIQISVAVIAVAFVILLYSLVQTLKILRAGLDEMRLTISQLRTDVTQIAVDVKEAVHNTNAMTLDIRTKLNSLDVLFTSVNDIGHTIHTFTGAAKESAASLVSSIKSGSGKPVRNNGIFHTIYDGVISSIRIWNKIKKI